MTHTSKFHFISGLSRSGSTLLAGILRPNPHFHAAMSSPVAGLLNSLLEQTGANSESYAFFDEHKCRRMCKALFESYYADKDYPVIFDTNRLWTARMHQLVELVDDFKIICCVSYLASILTKRIKNGILALRKHIVFSVLFS